VTRVLAKKDLATIQKRLSTYDQAREKILSLSRAATRLAGSTILEIHRGDVDSAEAGLAKIEQTLSRIDELSDEFSEFKTSSGVVVAFQEYIEALTLQTFVRFGRVPSIGDVKSDHRSYVLGLLDAVGEFRRMALNRLRRGEVRQAEKLLDAMEAIYDDLQGLDHTSIIPTFRVKMDASRRIIESTRGDVVTEVRRYSLEQALDRLGKKLGSDSKL
jgi:translin